MTEFAPKSRCTRIIVTLLIVQIVLVLAFWGILRLRERERMLRCQSNLRELYHVILNYATTHQGQLPDDWADMGGTIPPTHLRFLVCKQSTDKPPRGPTTQSIASELRVGGSVSYIYLGKGRSMRSLRPNAPLAYDPHPHEGDYLFLFGDGHQEVVPHARAIRMLQQFAAERAPTSVSTQPTTVRATLER